MRGVARRGAARQKRGGALRTGDDVSYSIPRAREGDYPGHLPGSMDKPNPMPTELGKQDGRYTTG